MTYHVSQKLNDNVWAECLSIVKKEGVTVGTAKDEATSRQPKTSRQSPFLNAIDRVERLKEKYIRTSSEIKDEIPKLLLLTAKPFLREQKLKVMKNELSSLERQIAIKIQESQLI